MAAIVYIFRSFSWGIFGYVTRLGQSRVSKKIGWIIGFIYSMFRVRLSYGREKAYATMSKVIMVNGSFMVASVNLKVF